MTIRYPLYAHQCFVMLITRSTKSLRAHIRHSRTASLLRSRSMATVRSSLPHEDRTAKEPRENRLEPVVLSHIRQINESIRTLRLKAVDPNHTIKVSLISTKCSSWRRIANSLPVKFTPGQWLDTFIPGLDKAGGFTITSTPSEARPSSPSPAFLELAVSSAWLASLTRSNSLRDPKEQQSACAMAFAARRPNTGYPARGPSRRQLHLATTFT